MKSPVITLLTDFGLQDHYVAAVKGVILGICPGARIVDISHDVTPFSISEGAYTLAQAWHCFPAGTIHVAVVDPGVGSSRRPIAAEMGGHRFVAPDNGILTLALAAANRVKFREINAKRYFRQPVSDTFHGRDVFAPIAAHLANGLVFSKLGPVISDPVRGAFADPKALGPGRWQGQVLKIDRFGNIITNLKWSQFHQIAALPFKLKIGRRVISRFRLTYSGAEPNVIFVLRGSSGYVEVSLNQSSAAATLAVDVGAQLDLTIGVPASTTSGTVPKVRPMRVLGLV